MTHPTNEELDEMARDLCHTGELSMPYRCEISDALTTLLTQLAEMKADRDAVAEGRDMMGRLWEKEKARADRAEAALAAQIEADAGIVDQMFYNPTTDADFSDDTNLNDWAGWATIGQLREWSSEAIRAQPHDRTALDRMLAEAREKALREAYQAVGRIVAGYELREDFRAEEVAGKCHDAILALIEAPDAAR